MPSPRLLEKIEDLFERSQRGEELQRDPLVLQNGTFASRGATRRVLKSKQADLFSVSQTVELKKNPSPPILSTLKQGKFFADAKHSLNQMLEDHWKPAKTIAQAKKLEISAGKNTYTYDAHTYHTKVPPQGIVEYIEQYLPEGGLILDPFAGSGMTGVASRVSGADVVMNELSPAACFIAHNLTESISPDLFAGALYAIMDKMKKMRKTLYSTICRECQRETEILYTVWSYRVVCYSCNREFLLWNHCRRYGRTVREHRILKEFACPSCGTILKKRRLIRTSTKPVMLGYKCCGGSQIEHPLTKADIERISKADSGSYLQEDYYPTIGLKKGVNLSQPIKHGLTSIDKFYSTRNLSAMSTLWQEIHRLNDTKLISTMALVFTSLYQRVTQLSEFRFWGGSGNTARFNVPFIYNEANVFVTFERKAISILDHLETTSTRYSGRKAVVCGSATDLDYLPDESIDFIFTDPPFGANINYSEMNILWESWLGEFTDNTEEAIVNKVQGKGVREYEKIMTNCLAECFRVLRCGHWMLLVFMNSSGEIWKTLKNSIRNAGFITERLDIFDKQHGTFKQFVSPNTAGCDLVLHCRKPFPKEKRSFEVKTISGEDSIASFMTERVGRVPITEYLHVTRDDELDIRRLYSEWLSRALSKEHEILDFSAFRTIVSNLGKFTNNHQPEGNIR